MWQPTLGFGSGAVTLALFAATNPQNEYSNEAWVAALVLAAISALFGAVGGFSFIKSRLYEWGLNRTYAIETLGYAMTGILHTEVVTIVVKRRTYTGGLQIDFAEYVNIDGYGGAPSPNFTTGHQRVQWNYVDAGFQTTLPRFLTIGERIGVEIEFKPISEWSGYLIVHSQDHSSDETEIRRGAAPFRVCHPS